MANNYPTSDSSLDDTYFEYENMREENLREVIANASQGRRDRLQALDHERTRPFTGFRNEDRPSGRSLSWLAQNRNTHGLLVSDSRNDPNYTGETVNNEHQRTTAQNRSNRSNIGLPLSSTLRRGGAINFPSTHNESPIVRTNNQPYNLGVRNQTIVTQHVTNSIRVDRNENIVTDERTLNNVSRQAVLGNGRTPVLQTSHEEQIQTPPRNLDNNNHVEEEVNMRQANNVQNPSFREPGLLTGNRSHNVHNMANNNNNERQNIQPQGNTNEHQRQDIGDYRQYFARKIRTDAKKLL